MRLVEFLKEKFDLAPTLPMPAGANDDAKEMVVSEMIPYTYHYDDETVITKDDGLVHVIKIDGIFFESLSPEEIRRFERQRNTLLRSIANSDRGIYVHLVRRKAGRYPSGEPEAWFARYLNERWKDRYRKRNFYVNEIYISVVRNRFRIGAPGVVDRIFTKLTGGTLRHDDAETFEEQAKDVYDVSNLIVQVLEPYGARRLRVQRRPNFTSAGVSFSEAMQAVERFKLDWSEFLATYGVAETYPAADVLDFLGDDYDEIGTFLDYLVNLEEGRTILTDQPLSQGLARHRINFQTVGNTMEVEGLSTRRAAAMLSMHEWPTNTPSRMLDEFLKQPVEFIITQSFFFVDRISAEADMKLQKRRMEANKDISGQADDIKEGMKELGSGRSVNGLHHLTILVHVPIEFEVTPQSRRQAASDLNEAITLLKKSFVGLNVKPVREYFALETFFWSQLPGQTQKWIGRRGKIKSANFAGFASLHNFAIGKIDGNLWGSAIMPFETESGTAYYFNFHREMEGMVAGHTTFAAETGAGKTTILSMLIAMADKARPRVFWFDNRHGAEVFMRAMGGQHTLLTALTSTGWNPLQLPDTADNRQYIVDLLSLMRTCYGGETSADDIARFKRLVDENYAFKNPRDRRLRNVSWCFGKGSDLDRVMSVWYGNGANAGAFDNESDNLDLSKCRHHCFEMRQLIKDGEARPELAVLLSYPFHRIEQSQDGSPFIIVLEEGQNLVKHDFWKKKIDAYYMQVRRKNGLLIFVTPDVKYLFCETDSIAKQSPTKIFLPTQEAVESDYMGEHIKLTRGEFEFVRDTPVQMRKFLIRRGDESIRAIFDLSDMPEVIPVLSSNDLGVRLMHDVMREQGTDDPTIWVPVFMERAIAKNTHNLNRKGASL
ncbi:type VI secretion protein [Xanthomonas albilineans]|uniref:VirB4 family type IV secretion/conjugal transfer ATPase n=1 Tax=Xanthomonas albilineans TaxID=29447 RepID=UPI0005F33E9A|nr:type VI secretion protein [Xanthomonas albilineans]